MSERECEEGTMTDWYDRFPLSFRITFRPEIRHNKRNNSNRGYPEVISSGPIDSPPRVLGSKIFSSKMRVIDVMRQNKQKSACT